MQDFTSFLQDEQGAATVEYSLIVLLVTAMTIPLLTQIGQQLRVIFMTVTLALSH